MQERLVIVSLIGLIICALASLAAAKGEAAELVKKLEAFARNPTSKSTGMSYGDYEILYRDNKENFSQKFLQDVRKVSASFRLLGDFIIAPMDRWRLSPDEDDVIKQAYVARIEQTYKRFWPSYVYHRAINSMMMYSAKRFLGFLNSMQRKVTEEPTLAMWHLAQEEYDALKLKAEEMAKYEDIYDHLDNYEHLLNFFNDPKVKFFMEYFSARMNKCETDQQMKSIVVEYRKLLGL